MINEVLSFQFNGNRDSQIHSKMVDEEHKNTGHEVIKGHIIPPTNGWTMEQGQ